MKIHLMKSKEAALSHEKRKGASLAPPVQRMENKSGTPASLKPGIKNGPAIVQRMSEQQHAHLMGLWREIENHLDQMFEENPNATLPISSELDAIRTLLGKPPDQVAFGMLIDKITEVKKWTGRSAQERAKGIAIDSESRKALGFPAAAAKQGGGKAAAPKAPDVQIVWDIHDRDKRKLDAFPKFLAALQDGRNYGADGKPTFANAHIDDTGKGQWKLQADREVRGAGTVDRLCIDVAVGAAGIKVTVKAFLEDTH